MQSFRIRLIVALIVGITLVSLASTYFEVLAHKHTLHRELMVRTIWIGNSLQPDIEQALTQGRSPDIAVPRPAPQPGRGIGLAVYDAHGMPIVADGPTEIFKTLTPGP